MTCIGIIAFQRDFGSPLIISDVLYVPGLRKNIFSVAILKTRGKNLHTHSRELVMNYSKYEY